MSTKSPHGVAVKPFIYQNFMGLDSSRDRTALDTGKDQHLLALNNGFCDWRGQITRDPGASRYAGRFSTRHIAFYAKDSIVWTEEDSAAIHLRSDLYNASDETPIGYLDNAFTAGSMVTSAVFNRNVNFFSAGQQSLYWDGNSFELNQSAHLDRTRPGFGVAISRRLATSGIASNPTLVELSHVDDHEMFPDDEEPGSTSVLRAGSIDIGNYVGSNEPITALARFEQSRLVIFTSDRAIIYAIDTDISNWTIDERANINVGCLNQNAVAQAGEDIIFCSRYGVHSLRRSRDNGVTILASAVSQKVDILYRQLLRSCPDPSFVSAVFDPDMGQLHIFFPQQGFRTCVRLTVTLDPLQQVEPKWSTGTFLNACAGASQGGRLFYGTPGGVYEVAKIEQDDAEFYPDLEVLFPMLWHGTYFDTKSTHSLVVQASGNGICDLIAINDDRQTFHSDHFEVSDTSDDNNFPDVPLSAQYERRFEHRYRGAQFRLTVSGKGLLRIVGFAVMVRKE